MTSYHATDNTYNYGFEAENDTFSFTSNRQKVKNALTEEQKLDKGFFQLMINAFTTGKAVTIPVYASGSHGSTIRGAVTGANHTGYIVGTKDEDFFYGVIVSSSIVGKGRREPITLFFENPEQYERHMHTKVLVADKHKWVAKYTAAVNADAKR